MSLNTRPAPRRRALSRIVDFIGVSGCMRQECLRHVLPDACEIAEEKVFDSFELAKCDSYGPYVGMGVLQSTVTLSRGHAVGAQLDYPAFLVQDRVLLSVLGQANVSVQDVARHKDAGLLASLGGGPRAGSPGGLDCDAVLCCTRAGQEDSGHAVVDNTVPLVTWKGRVIVVEMPFSADESF